MLKIVLCLAVAFASLGAGAQTAHYGKHVVSRGVIAPLPDHKVTPGVADPDAIVDLSGKHHIQGGIERNLCADDFRTAPIRASIVNFAKLKAEACAEYGVKKCDASVEGDHLISLENGGCKDCLANIQPQPVDAPGIIGYHTKDIVENRTHKLICSGAITLKQAQDGLAGDWYQFAHDHHVLPSQTK